MDKKIAIVGGGPAGSSLALWLLEEGVDPDDLLILDQARFPRPKLCGGALTWRGTRLLESLLGELEGGSRTQRLVFRSELGCVEVRERGAQWLYDRGALDEALLRRCQRAGVQVREGTRVQAVERGAGGWRVRTPGGVESFPWVVGADGVFSKTRRGAGLAEGHLGRLIEGIFEARPGAGGEGGLRRDSLIFDFDPITAGIAGYAWIFPMPGPRGAGLWKVGMMDGRGRSSGGALRGWLSAFAERSGLRPAEGKVGGWPERFFQPGARAHRPGLCLVGDAWGVDPLLGEGLAPSLEMSRFAARRLKRALDRGRSSLGAYALAFLNTEEGRNLSFQRLLANRLYGRHPFRWMRALFSNAELRRRAGSGQEAYGRLLPLAPRLLGSFAEQVLREGMPPNAAPSSEARSLSACPRPDA